MLVESIFSSILPQEEEIKKEFLELIRKAESVYSHYNIIPVFRGMLEIYEKNSQDPILLVYYMNGEEYNGILNFEFKNTHSIFHITLEEEIPLEDIGEMFENCKSNY